MIHSWTEYISAVLRQVAALDSELRIHFGDGVLVLHDRMSVHVRDLRDKEIYCGDEVGGASGLFAAYALSQQR